MSAARSDLVNAVELAERSATLERRYSLEELPRLVEVGALEGTRAHARLSFSKFESWTTVEVGVEGCVTLPCQRCLRPCECPVEESAQLVVVADDTEDVPGGFEPALGDAERLSLTALVEEQLLLGLPLVPLHEDEADCGTAVEAPPGLDVDAPEEEKQRPFANLRELLGQDER